MERQKRFDDLKDFIEKPVDHEYTGNYTVERCMIICGNCAGDIVSDIPRIGDVIECEMCGHKAKVINKS